MAGNEVTLLASVAVGDPSAAPLSLRRRLPGLRDPADVCRAAAGDAPSAAKR